MYPYTDRGYGTHTKQDKGRREHGKAIQGTVDVNKNRWWCEIGKRK